MVFTRDTSKKFKDKKLNVKNINTTNLKKATHFLYVQGEHIQNKTETMGFSGSGI
jgi:hypothetical protein